MLVEKNCSAPVSAERPYSIVFLQLSIAVQRTGLRIAVAE